MIVVLYGLSLLMIAGGATAVVMGMDIIVLERGWTAVIAGATFGTGGCLMIGIAVLAQELKRTRDAQRAGGVAAWGASSIEKNDGERTRVDLQDTAENISQNIPGETSRDSAFAASRRSLRALETSRDVARSPDSPAPRTARLTSSERAQFVSSKQTTQARNEEPPLPSQDTSERTVLGSYMAGGHAYVMFSDGSIEADTKEGVFRFGSMSELKTFVASGGLRPKP